MGKWLATIAAAVIAGVIVWLITNPEVLGGLKPSPNNEKPAFIQNEDVGGLKPSPNNEKPAIERVTLSTQEVTGGESLVGHIHLRGPNHQERRVRLIVHDEGYREPRGLAPGTVVSVPEIVRVLPGDNEAEFPIRTARVDAAAAAGIEARLGTSMAEAIFHLLPGERR